MMKPGESIHRDKGTGRKTTYAKNIDDVDLKNFCAAAACEGWSVFKQRRRQWEPTRRPLQPQSKQSPSSKTKKYSSEAIDESACFLWNPDSREKINLPNLPGSSHPEFRYSKCILTAPPTAPQCSVLFLAEKSPKVLFCRPGANKWADFSYNKYEEDRGIYLFDAIICNEKLYMIDRWSKLSEVVVGPRKLDLKRYHARLPTRSSEFNKDQLVDSCGELFAVRRNSIYEINVYKMDFSIDRWEKVLNLGGHRIFVLIGDYSASFSAVELGISGNKIFFTEKDDYDGSLYSFSLPDKSLSVWRNDPKLGTLWVSHDEMLSALRFPDKPRSYKQIIKERKEIHENPSIQESRDQYNSDDENRSESIWLQLPADLQKLIVQHLPTVFDYMNFRAVCRMWRPLVLPIQWKPNPGGIPFKHPWLMFSQGETGLYSFYDPICNSTHSISLPELESCEVRFSKQGWLLVTKAPTSIFFFEPFTRTRIQLPDLHYNNRFEFDGLCFSDPPTSSNWKILGITHLYQSYILILYLQSGDQDWTFQKIDPVAQKLPLPSFANPVFDGQSFCYLGKDGGLVFFEIEETGFDWFVEYVKIKGTGFDWFGDYTSSSRLLSSYSSRFLVCYENELISVFLDQVGRSTLVFKLDRREHRWIEIKSMKKEILYLSRTTSLSVEAMDQKIRNTIQFSMFSDIHDNNSNVSYSFKNERYQTYNASTGVYSSLADPYDTKEFLRATWIQPLVVPQVTPAV